MDHLLHPSMAFIIVFCLLPCLASAEPFYQSLHIASLIHEEPLSKELTPLQWARPASDDSSLTLLLMHRDSPRSPFRPAIARPQELLERRLARDAARVEALTRRAQMAAQGIKGGDLKVKPVGATLQDFNGPVVSGLLQGSGEYFTRLGIGSPARDNYMVLDTGSDIVWIQCDPCSNCYNQTDPLFNPLHSSSYENLPCSSPLCSKLDLHGCQPRTNHCLYQVAYGDGSFTTGNFALETLNFKGANMSKVPFGCGHDNEGLFVGAAGLLGLGGGPLSFPSQVGARYGNKFSYCLVERNTTSTSEIAFGEFLTPAGTVFTPMVKNPKLETFYYVRLAGISVGGSRLSIPASAFELDVSGNGGVIVDSGTSVTRLVETAYGPLRSAFRAATRNLTFAGGFAVFDTCYTVSSKNHSVNVPTVVLHFENAADMVLPASNYLVPVDNSGTVCFAFATTAGELSIIGNIQQQGFRVIFDVESSRVGFASNQCK